MSTGAGSDAQATAGPPVAVGAGHVVLAAWGRRAAVVLAIVCTYVALDFISRLHPVQDTEITAWSPEIAMLVAVVMHYGARIAPVTILLPWLSEIIANHGHPFGIPALATIASIGVTFTATGLILRRLLPGSRLGTARGFAILLAIITLAAFVDALSYSSTLFASQRLATGTLLEAITTDWIGDINGIVILLPCLLLMRRGSLQVRSWRAHPAELPLQWLTLAACFLVVFDWAETASLHLFYLFFLPINWIALRWGARVTAYTLVALQAAVVMQLTIQPAPESVLSIQLLMVVLAVTGLFMGITMSENARFARRMRSKDDELEHLNRLAIVSEFSATAAHELNNPLSALQNYLGAARLQIGRPEVERAAVEATLDKALGEAGRASAVLRRLRAFFRSGAVQKERVDPRALVNEVVITLQPRFLRKNIVCTIDAPQVLPMMNVDALQLSVVLHNLLSNGCDAIRDSGAGNGRIQVAIRPAGEVIEFKVTDTGGGVPPAEVPLLFHALATHKSNGMGMGLAISRSLIEANGGHIRLVDSRPGHTRFAFTVPVAGATMQVGAGDPHGP